MKILFYLQSLFQLFQPLNSMYVYVLMLMHSFCGLLCETLNASV